MNADAKLLTLVQWLSPAFPTGAFAFSHGLESAIQNRWVNDADDLEHWLRDCLTDGTARMDAVWLRLSFASDDPKEIDAQARSFVMGRERLREAERQGAAFAKTARAVWCIDIPTLILPVAVGRSAQLANLDIETTVSLYLQAFVSNLVSAGIRLHLFGQTSGQAVVHSVQEDILRTTASTRGAMLQDAFSNTFLSDIAAMKHETLEPRLFQS